MFLLLRIDGNFLANFGAVGLNLNLVAMDHMTVSCDVNVAEKFSFFFFFLLFIDTMAIGKGILLKADIIAETFSNEVKTSLSQYPRPPRLVGILATSSSPSKYYADFTQKQCDALGFGFELKKIGAAQSSDFEDGYGVEEAIIKANEDPDVDGIMVRNLDKRAEPLVDWKVFCAGVLSDIWLPAGWCILRSMG